MSATRADCKARADQSPLRLRAFCQVCTSVGSNHSLRFRCFTPLSVMVASLYPPMQYILPSKLQHSWPLRCLRYECDLVQLRGMCVSFVRSILSTKSISCADDGLRQPACQ